jgi:hypothetical protein
VRLPVIDVGQSRAAWPVASLVCEGRCSPDLARFDAVAARFRDPYARVARSDPRWIRHTQHRLLGNGLAICEVCGATRYW